MHVERSQEMNQLKGAICDLEANVNVKIRSRDAQLQMVKDNGFELSSNNEVVKINIYEVFVIFQPTKLKIIQNVEIEKIKLELQENVNQTILRTSLFCEEDVKKGVNSYIERLKLHFNHLFMLYLIVELKIEIIKLMENFREEGQSFYILEFGFCHTKVTKLYASLQGQIMQNAMSEKWPLDFLIIVQRAYHNPFCDF